MKKVILISVLISSVLAANAQDAAFTTINQNYIYLNPAFTGTAKNFRITNTYRNQWTDVSGGFLTNNLSIDQHLDKYGGIGLSYLNDNSSEGVLITNIISLNYSKGITLGKKNHFNFGVSGSWYRRNIDFSKLTFGSMINPRNGYIYSTQVNPNNSVVTVFDWQIGALYYNDKFYFGYSVAHLAQPNISFVEGATPLYRKHSAQIGYKYTLNKNWSFLPSTNATLQQDFLQIMGLMQVKWKWAILGAGLGTSHNNIAMLGVGFSKWRLVYSYDKTTSQLTNNKEVSHEISLQYYLNLSKKDNENPFNIY